MDAHISAWVCTCLDSQDPEDLEAESNLALVRYSASWRAMWQLWSSVSPAHVTPQVFIIFFISNFTDYVP